MGIIDSLVVGIVSGIFATLFIVVFQQMWIRIITPWYEEKIYVDARIEGRWNARYPGTPIREVVEIQRVGHAIHGTMTETSGPDRGKIYDFSGTFRNLILTASYTSANRAHLDRGSFTLMLTENGMKLQGYCTFYEDTQNEIVSNEYELSKQNA